MALSLPTLHFEELGRCLDAVANAEAVADAVGEQANRVLTEKTIHSEEHFNRAAPTTNQPQAGL